jgi:FixJ family two-component response regulator
VTEPRDRVLVVDDDHSVRRALERLLRAAGYHVVTFESARDFLERADCAQAACLILDVRMPGPSGLDLYEALVDGGYRIPAVFITGHADAPMVTRAMTLGAVELVPKVFDDETLLAAVARAIARRRASRAS